MNKKSNTLQYKLAVILFGLGGLFMSKNPTFQRAGMSEGGLPLPPAFHYLILMLKRACDLSLVIMSSHQNCKSLKLGCLFFIRFII